MNMKVITNTAKIIAGVGTAIYTGVGVVKSAKALYDSTKEDSAFAKAKARKDELTEEEWNSEEHASLREAFEYSVELRKQLLISVVLGLFTIVASTGDAVSGIKSIVAEYNVSAIDNSTLVASDTVSSLETLENLAVA